MLSYVRDERRVNDHMQRSRSAAGSWFYCQTFTESELQYLEAGGRWGPVGAGLGGGRAGLTVV